MQISMFYMDILEDIESKRYKSGATEKAETQVQS